MSLSQFTIYRSTDASAPVLYGASGSLLTVLNAVLINGYGTQPAAGWTQPLGTSGTGIVAYKQAAGAGMTLMVNDAAAGTAGAKEALACGWTTPASEASPLGTGTNQFPTPAQLASGVAIRKSNTADSTNARAWAILADSSTFYLFIQSGDIAGSYMAFAFGDFYSLAGPGLADPYRCFIVGRGTQNSTANDLSTGGLDQIGSPGVSFAAGFYWANSLAGSSGSQAVQLFGDMGKTNDTGAALKIAGSIPSPNPYDLSYYLAPLFLGDSSNGLRGYLRGLYQLCHATTNFSDGQTFSGANDYAGKTFTVWMKGSSGGMFCMETSATVNTN